MVYFVTSNSDGFTPFNPLERQLEAMILQLADSALPGWIVRKWKKRVYTPDGRGAEADILMVAEDMSDWVVVEVELGHHSITHHIEDQLERLASAEYGAHLIPSLAEFGLSEAELRMVTKNPPGFLCIVDEWSARLRDCCKTTGFALATMRPFYDARNVPGLLCDVPSEFRSRRRAVGEFALVRSPETLFGKQPFQVPATFPELNDVLVRFGGTSFKANLTRLGGNRIVFMPPEIVGAMRSDVLRLAAIDVTAGTFEVIRE